MTLSGAALRRHGWPLDHALFGMVRRVNHSAPEFRLPECMWIRKRAGGALTARRSVNAIRECTSPTPSDAEIVQRAIQDPQAFSIVFERYHRDIYLYCLRRLGNPQDADDAASTVFMKAYSALGTFRPRSGGTGVTFRSWMFAMAKT